MNIISTVTSWFNYPFIVLTRREAGTCYDKLIHQIWNACLHPLRKYEMRCKMSNMEWFGVVRGHPRSIIIAPFDRARMSTWKVCPYLAPFLRYSEISIKKRRCEPTTPLFGAPVGVILLECRWDFWHRKTRVPGLSYGVVNVILGLAIFVQLQLVTDGQTDRQTDGRTDGQSYDDS